MIYISDSIKLLFFVKNMKNEKKIYQWSHFGPPFLDVHGQSSSLSVWDAT